MMIEIAKPLENVDFAFFALPSRCRILNWSQTENLTMKNMKYGI